MSKVRTSHPHARIRSRAVDRVACAEHARSRIRIREQSYFRRIGIRERRQTHRRLEEDRKDIGERKNAEAREHHIAET